MKFLLFILLVICLNVSDLSAQLDGSVGARQASMGGSSVTNNDMCSGWNNQAGLGYIEDVTILINYENRFLIPELASKNLGVIYPSSYGVVGISISDFGFDSYNERMIGLSYGRLFKNGLAIGMSIDYMRYKITPEYGSSSMATIETGVMYNLGGKMIFAFHLFNPVFADIGGASGEPIPTIFNIGLAYKPTDKAAFVVEFEKDIGFSPRIRAGIEYVIVDNFLLRTGVANNPVESSFGFGYVLNQINIDIAFVTNFTLGVTPVITLGYRF